jgi:site-specific DNA-methyltransferase (adenine-specific)
MKPQKTPSPRNQTVVLSDAEQSQYLAKTITLTKKTSIEAIINSTILQDCIDAMKHIPDNSIDLAVIDPPYNLTKDFGTIKFKKEAEADFLDYTRNWLTLVIKKLKSTGSIYVCCDWKSSNAIYIALGELCSVRNRITWQREKGRGSHDNWKNGMEDIWYATKSKAFTFNIDAVKIQRKVIAPYRKDGVAKDWFENEQGKFRMTHPSNFWDDITIPFWSMPENTDHPTQKPEKLIAKLILASSNTNDIVFDCFVGSGTTSVVAKKLGRRYVGIEIDPYYAAITEKRLTLGEYYPSIQGYENGMFWERNSEIAVKTKKFIQKSDNTNRKLSVPSYDQPNLFG